MKYGLIAVVLLTGCAGGVMTVPDDVPFVRCTEYAANGNTPMTGSSVRADGCQCAHTGGFEGRVEYEGEKCSLTLEANR